MGEKSNDYIVKKLKERAQRTLTNSLNLVKSSNIIDCENGIALFQISLSQMMMAVICRKEGDIFRNNTSTQTKDISQLLTELDDLEKNYTKGYTVATKLLNRTANDCKHGISTVDSNNLLLQCRGCYEFFEKLSNDIDVSLKDVCIKENLDFFKGITPEEISEKIRKADPSKVNESNEREKLISLLSAASGAMATPDLPISPESQKYLDDYFSSGVTDTVGTITFFSEIHTRSCKQCSKTFNSVNPEILCGKQVWICPKCNTINDY